MVDATRVAAVVLRHAPRLGAERVRRRLSRVGLSARQIEAGFRFAAFLATRGGVAIRRPLRRPGLAAAVLAGWSAVVLGLLSLRLWAGAIPQVPASLPEDVWVSETLAAYAPPPFGRPEELDALLPERPAGNAGVDYLEAASAAARRGPRLFFRGGLTGLGPAVEAVRRGALKRGCGILGVLETPDDDDAAARLPMLVSALDRVAGAVHDRLARRIAAERWDLAQQDALVELAIGRHWLEEWLPQAQAAGLARVTAALDALGRCLAARGRLDPRTRVRLGQAAAQARAYAARPDELARIPRLAADASRLSELDRYLDLEPLRRPYAYAALEAAAVGWGEAERARGTAAAARVEWLRAAGRRPDARVRALAQGALKRLFRAQERLLLKNEAPAARRPPALPMDRLF